MTAIGHNGGPDIDLEEGDYDLAMMFARFNINDILKTLFEMRSLEDRGFFCTALFVMYDRGGYLPLDDNAAARAMAMDVRQYRRLKRIFLAADRIRETARGYTHDRVIREIEKFCHEQERRRDAAIAREEKKRLEKGNASGTSAVLQMRSDGDPADLRQISGRSPGDLLPISMRTESEKSQQVSEKSNEINGCTATTVVLCSATRVPLARALPKPKPIREIGESQSPQPTHSQEPTLSEASASDDDELFRELTTERGAPPKPRQARPYSAEFEAFWLAYPDRTNNSKPRAFDAWKRLDAASRQQAMAGLAGYVAYLRSKPDLRVVHAERYLSQRRFEGFAAQSQTRPWWEDPAKVASLSAEDWKRLIRKHANGTWPIRELCYPPGHERCIVPRDLVREWRLSEIYDSRGLMTQGAHVPWKTELAS